MRLRRIIQATNFLQNIDQYLNDALFLLICVHAFIQIAVICGKMSTLITAFVLSFVIVNGFFNK